MPLLLLSILACAPPDDAASRTLVIAAYTTPRELLDGHVLPAFRERWREATGESLRFETSFQGSGAQARAVAGGLEADVVWLSLEPDVQRLVDEGLVARDWKEGPTRGVVSSSLVVIGVRPGNPRGVAGWSDLRADGLEVLTPNVRTSGGAMWNVLALTGAAGRVEPPLDPQELLAGVLRNVRVMDKGARESILSFEKGVGDAIVTYENEVVVARRGGQPIDYVVPSPTLVIENPAAVVDAYAAKRGTTDVARAFVEFLTEPAQQEAMVRYGLRPVVPGVDAVGLPAAEAVFTVGDLGGWSAVQQGVFGEGALYDRALERARSGR